MITIPFQQHNQLNAWAADIRRKRHVGDLNRWQDHNSYQKAFSGCFAICREGKRKEGTTPG
jgi:hypothetical protein